MKQYSLGVLILSSILLLGVGCAQTNITIKNIEPAATSSTFDSQMKTTTSDRPTAQKDLAIYKQWSLSKEFVDMHKSDFSHSNKDCVDILNGDTQGKDLLSTLIVDDYARSMMSLEVYTPDYVRNLEKKITDNFHQSTRNDFYAFKVCHLGENIDVVAGYLWPQGTPTITNAGTVHKDFNKNGSVVVINGSTVLPYFNLTLLDATVTGGEVAPCKASWVKNWVKWSCFVSVNKPKMTQEKYHYWLLPLDATGEIITGDDTLPVN